MNTVSYKDPEVLKTGFLDFKVYFKETDTHSLLHKKSFHPKHTFKGIIKSQLLRFNRICTQPSSFYSVVKTLFTALKHRGYSRTFLRKILQTFDASMRPESPFMNGVVPVSTTHTPHP